jgi:proline racemase
VTRVVLDTPAGLVETEAVLRYGHVESVSFVSTPSFLLADGVQVALPGGTALTVDVAWGGNFYAIVPAEQAGVDLDSPGVAPRIALAADIRDAVDAVRDPRIGVLVLDHTDSYRYSQIRGTARLDSTNADALIDELSRKYTGNAWVEKQTRPRVNVIITPAHQHDYSE